MIMKKAIELIEKDYLKSDIPEFKVGDTVRISQRIQEGDKSRLQAFEGVVIFRRGRGTGETFSVLKVEQTDSVEKTFPVHSPLVEKITVVKAAKPKLKKSKLYHLRKQAEKK